VLFTRYYKNKEYDIGADEGDENSSKILIGKPEGKRSLERPGHRWLNNIKMDLKDISCEDVG